MYDWAIGRRAFGYALLNDSTYAVETSQVYYRTMQEDFTQNRLHPGISMRFETCEVRVRLFKCLSPINDLDKSCLVVVHLLAIVQTADEKRDGFFVPSRRCPCLEFVICNLLAQGCLMV